jgi:hypothetical protein
MAATSAKFARVWLSVAAATALTLVRYRTPMNLSTSTTTTTVTTRPMILRMVILLEL